MTNAKKILLVEDEAHVVSFIKKGLGENGFDVSVALDSNMGYSLFQNGTFDLIILDIMLPGINGLELCKKIREENQTVPVLFLTALGTAENIVLGLESGGDDYLVKPFKFIELLARIKTLIRRSDAYLESKKGNIPKDIYIVGDLKIDDYSKEVRLHGELISLTSTEYKLLLYFVKNKNKVLSRMEILEAVWGVDFDLGTNVVDVYVNYLRKKLDAKTDEKLIHTIIGMGYTFKHNS